MTDLLERSGCTAWENEELIILIAKQTAVIEVSRLMMQLSREFSLLLFVLSFSKKTVFNSRWANTQMTSCQAWCLMLCVLNPSGPSCSSVRSD